ncbi:MAG: GntR family transcriptional regulator [Treponema sp.]|jgi:DNA-binding GntR family transcriptional regulator|nr:GntR family transcriptional regulator [Treponema sp.]
MDNSTASAKQNAYDAIKHNILHCIYRPNSYLSESMLTREFGLGRTPVREALTMLEKEGWLSIEPQRGVIVSDLSINEIHQVFEARMMIEPYILEKFGETIDKDVLAGLNRNFLKALSDSKSGNLEKLIDADNKLHMFIVKHSNNRYSINTMELLIEQLQRIRTMVNTRWEEAGAEHLSFVKAVLESDYREAANLLRLHLENSKKGHYDTLISNGGWKLPET